MAGHLFSDAAAMHMARLHDLALWKGRHAWGKIESLFEENV